MDILSLSHSVQLPSENQTLHSPLHFLYCIRQTPRKKIETTRRQRKKEILYLMTVRGLESSGVLKPGGSPPKLSVVGLVGFIVVVFAVVVAGVIVVVAAGLAPPAALHSSNHSYEQIPSYQISHLQKDTG